jgi:4-hydroxy-3-polyprenylbenzoate decarboxylase
MNKRTILALTGASGMAYALSLLENLTTHGREVHVVISDAARKVLELEEGDCTLRFSAAKKVYTERDISAPFASGSWKHAGMVVCPCSMASLSAIANGLGSNLIHRAADVTLKERRPLILVPRETPLNRVHLKNMLAAHDSGACILPPCPGFYTHPRNLDDLLLVFTSRVMDQLGIENNLSLRWEGDVTAPAENITA